MKSIRNVFVRASKMLKMSRRSAGLMLVFFIFCIVPISIAKDDSQQRLVSREALKPAELEILWETKLPIETGESLERLFILDNRIYGLSSHNYLVSMNREKGNVIFSRPISGADFPVIGFGLYENELFSVAGNRLIELDSDSGEELSSKQLMLGVTCPVARNKLYFYVAETDNRIHALRSKDKVQVFEVAAEDGSTITSIAADDNSVVFATRAGDIVSITPDKSVLLWKFKAIAGGSIAQPIVKEAESVFASSRDTNIYRFGAKKGEVIWKYQMGAMLEKGPEVTEKIVYQYARNEGLSAIDKENGKLLWRLQEGIDLLAEGVGKSYVITNMKTLAVMDNKKVKQICTIDLPNVSRYAVNVIDSKIYIADKNGRIACLQPIKY
jgi:hypothetical protein